MNSPSRPSPPTSPSTPPRPPNASAPWIGASNSSTTSTSSRSGRTPAGSIAVCLRLGALDSLAELRLIQWAHMLGFRGHFSTKSRRYSTTLGALRAAREEHKCAENVTTGRLPLFEEDTVLVIAHWEYAGQGLSLGDQLLAAALTGTRLPATGGDA
ncbi:replication initiator [Nonomuraea ferruginea]